jgi:DNA-binding response OmpR family regulator
MRVLIVEHYDSGVRALRRCLCDAGFHVDVAEQGEAADDKARLVGYDLIVLSLALPGNKSSSLLRSWRGAGIRCPIVSLAANGDVSPVWTLLRRAFRTTDRVMRVRDLEINTSCQTVKRAGQLLHLTPREYAVLQFLAFHCGKVVTRSMIWEHLYNESPGKASNVIDVFIRNLRLKVDNGFAPRLILSCYGKGYLLRGEDSRDQTAVAVARRQ